MILFTNNLDLVGLLRESHPTLKITVANFTSAYSGYDDVTALATRINKIQRPVELTTRQFMETPGFDAAYAMTVLNDPKMFEALMRIILHDFEGEVVILLIQRDDYRDAIMDTLMKLIQIRYGKGSWVVEEDYDLEFMDEDSIVNVATDYTSDGLLRLDEDRKRYLELVNTGVCAPVIEPVNVEV